MRRDDAFADWTPPVAALAGVAMTCFIELVRHWILGRIPDVHDLVANASGVWAVLLVVRRRSARTGRV